MGLWFPVKNLQQVRRELAEVERLQAQMLVWREHWLAHLQQGRVKLAIVVGSNRLSTSHVRTNSFADDEDDNDDW